jgi:hypothetical protein
MLNRAEVVRFESQLTVPTRDRAHLSDLWIAVSCRTGFASWAAEFVRIAPGNGAAGPTAGTLQVVAMSAHKGWVVARGVDLSIHGDDEIEEMVRSVVARVNLGTQALPQAESTAPSPLHRSRVSAAVMQETSAWRRMFSPRPVSTIDAVSGS